MKEYICSHSSSAQLLKAVHSGSGKPVLFQRLFTRFIQRKAPLGIIFVSLLCLLTACVHRLDIQQGNVITQEMVAKLSKGMAQRQVLGVVGTPMVIDPFSSDRWDYVYSMKSGRSDGSQFSHVTLYFKQGILDNIVVHDKPLKEAEIRSMERNNRKNI